MAANDFNNSDSGQQDEAYRGDGESAIAPGSGRFPKLAPRKFADDDDLPGRGPAARRRTARRRAA